MVTYLKYVGAPTFCFRHAAKHNPRIDPAKCGIGHYTRWTAETLSLLLQPLQHGLDAGIDGEVRDAGAADDVGLARDVGEMQEAAEVVILVENVEERLDFRGAELKGGESHGLAELAHGGKVAIHNFAKAQHGRTTNGFGTWRIIAPQCSAPCQPREARVWRAAPGFGKMLAAIPTTERNTL